MTVHPSALRRPALVKSLVAAGVALLVLAFAFATFRFFAGRAVLVKAEYVEPSVRQLLEQANQSPREVTCPQRDLRPGDSVVCSLRFSDGAERRVRFAVEGRPGSVTPALDPV